MILVRQRETNVSQKIQRPFLRTPPKRNSWPDKSVEGGTRVRWRSIRTISACQHTGGSFSPGVVGRGSSGGVGGGGGRIVRTELEGPRVRQSALMRGPSGGEGLGQLVTAPPSLPPPRIFPHLRPPIQPVKPANNAATAAATHAKEPARCPPRVSETRRVREWRRLRLYAALRRLRSSKGLSSSLRVRIMSAPYCRVLAELRSELSERHDTRD